jgi:alpha-tubulin suppressor-like RCC1 family protein
LALNEEGEVYGWGSNGDNQLLDYPSRTIQTPTLLPLPRKQKYVAMGAYHSVCISEDGSVLVFGQNAYGELGLGLKGLREHCGPSVLPLPSKVVQAACGWCHTLFLTEEGEVYACGRNIDGELGIGHTIDQTTPVKVEFPENVKISEVACAANYVSFARSSEGAVYSWGYNNDGCLGLGDFDPRNLPSLVSGIPEPVVALACGDRHTFALTRSSSLYGWGWNGKEQLGIESCASLNRVSSPTLIPLPFPVNSVACGYYHSVAFTSDGKVYFWGGRDYCSRGTMEDDGEDEDGVLNDVDWRPWVWGWQSKWEKAGKWVFLARQSVGSAFAGIPVEAIFHFVGVLTDTKLYF